MPSIFNPAKQPAVSVAQVMATEAVIVPSLSFIRQDYLFTSSETYDLSHQALVQGCLAPSLNQKEDLQGDGNMGLQ